jgi:serine protease Do
MLEFPHFDSRKVVMKRAFIIFLALSLILGMTGCLVPVPNITAPSIPQNQTPATSTPKQPLDTGWSPPQPQTEAPILPSIADVVEKVYPSVVAINTEVVTLDIFRTPLTQKGAGSGWIIDKNGIIVTNNHVVEGAKKVTVELSDGRTFEADHKNIHTDQLTDLAVIKIDATDLPAASVGDSSQLRVGDWVVAIGNPLGEGIRAKEGTVSGLKVSLDVEQSQTLDDLIETSAAINPGNSGGPLVNMKAEVIGITSAKVAAVGVEGLGYAISTKTAIPIIEQLITKGYIVRPWLGVTLQTVDKYVAMINRLPVDKGVVVAYVKPGSPAAQAGLQEYDVITRFKGKEVTTADELINAIHDSDIGEEVTITFVRGNETKTTTARLIQSPSPGS